jgi:hypothetical protein
VQITGEGENDSTFANITVIILCTKQHTTIAITVAINAMNSSPSTSQFLLFAKGSKNNTEPARLRLCIFGKINFPWYDEWFQRKRGNLCNNKTKKVLHPLSQNWPFFIKQST